MKLRSITTLAALTVVALYMSAWIEIAYGPNDGGPIGMVALYMSAWIEIRNLALYVDGQKVALLVSAWIEIHLPQSKVGALHVALYVSA